MTGSVALVGGKVRTLDRAGTVAEALLIEDGAVVVVGTSRDVTARAGEGTPVIDLGGRTAMPGLIDAHAHLELSALAEQAWLDVRAAPVPATVERVVERAAVTPAGSWVVAQGTFGQPLPDRAQLDAAVPGHPVVIRESMHRLVANSRALERSGIDRRFVEPAGARVLRTADGEPTGVVEEGFDLLDVPWEDAAWLEHALPAQAMESFVRYGVTAVHELPASAAALDAWQRLAGSDRMPCRIVLNPILAPGHQPTVSGASDVAALRGSLGALHPWLTVGALKLFLDGAGEAAWMRPQLAGRPSGWGLAPFAYAELRAVLASCREAGVQVWMHAVGSVAQELALDAVEETNRTHPSADHRSRIEHVGNAICDPAILPRLAPAGVDPRADRIVHAPLPRAGAGHRPEPLLPVPNDARDGTGAAGQLRQRRHPALRDDSLARGGGAGAAPDRRWRPGASRGRGADPRAKRCCSRPGSPPRQRSPSRLQGSLEPGKHGDVAVFGNDPLGCSRRGAAGARGRPHDRRRPDRPPGRGRPRRLTWTSTTS